MKYESFLNCLFFYLFRIVDRETTPHSPIRPLGSSTSTRKRTIQQSDDENEEDNEEADVGDDAESSKMKKRPRRVLIRKAEKNK